jgi:hypothetical protein
VKDFFDELNLEHRNSINNIRELIDVESDKIKQYPEYKDAAVLCKFIFDYENKYELLAHPENYGYFYKSSLDFERLCNEIYHSLVDDGDIAFIQLTDHLCPRIAFKSRWEIAFDDLITEGQKQALKSINEFKLKKGLPLEEYTLTFYNNVYEYIEAVHKHNVEAEERHKRAKVILNNLYQSKSKEDTEKDLSY